MTLLLRWLSIPILLLIALLFWKGSPLLIKSALLIIPVVGIASWFVHEGALNGSGGLAKIYGLVALITFLLCYEVGLLFHRFYLAKNGLNTIEDSILLMIGLVLLIVSIVYFLIAISK